MRTLLVPFGRCNAQRHFHLMYGGFGDGFCIDMGGIASTRAVIPATLSNGVSCHRGTRLARPVSVDQTTLAVIEKLYAAAMDESRWQDVMQEYLVLTDSVAATFCAIDASDKPRFAAFTWLNFEQGFMDEYVQGMMLHDPTNQYIIAHPRQRLVHDSEVITEREKDRHFYYDWHDAGGSDTRHRLAGMALLEENLTSGITVHRTKQQGDYHQSHIERFEFLLPHLERAVSIGFRLGTFGAAQQVSFQLLDANPQAIVILDERGYVAIANSAAHTIATAQEGVVLSAGGVHLQNRTDNDKLQKLIGRALRIAKGEPGEPAGVMQALRRSGKRPYSILVSPLCRTALMLTRIRPAACIVIGDPEQSPAIADDVLRSLYGFTPAEVRLAAKLASGMSLQSAAEELAISYKTARTQLAVIFRKTSTSRQGELVKFLLSSPIEI